MRKYSSQLFVFVLFLNFQNAFSQSPINLDVLFKGAIVYDGITLEGQVKDVGIKGDRIQFIGDWNQSETLIKQVIDAEGLILAPGFIDPHTHIEGDLNDSDRRNNIPFLMQGVTTIFGGNDGGGPLPIGRKLDEWEKNGIGTNAGLFIGHGKVRSMVLGNKNVAPDASQLKKMEEMVAQGMEEGAVGLSTGLFYAPGSFATTEEIVALAQVAHRYNGIYDTHMRDESSYSIGLINSVKETLKIAEKSGIPVHISHIKALGADVWGKSEEIIALIKKAREKGIKVTANQYPYEASKTSFRATVIPRWAEEGGYASLLERIHDPELKDSLERGIRENIRRRGGPATLMLNSADWPEIDGKTIADLVGNWGMPATEVVLKIVGSSSGVGVISFNMKEKDILNFMKEKWVVTGSDGAAGHPRKYGSFTRKLAHYTRDEKAISLGHAINTSSSKTALVLGLEERGFIKLGYMADIILFDLDRLKEKATYANPFKLSEGMEYVLVNGQFAVNKGKPTGILAGKAIRKFKQRKPNLK